MELSQSYSNQEPIKVRIDLSKLNLSKIAPKTTIKKGRSKLLNIHKNQIKRKKQKLLSQSSDFINLSKQKINLLEQVAKTLSKTIQIDKIKKGPKQDMVDQYEPSLHMFELEPTLMECVEEMACNLHLLDLDQVHLFKIKEVFETDIDLVLKEIAREKYLKLKKEFLKETKERGKHFFKPFEKMYNYYGTKNCLMVIFVETIKSKMKREKIEIKRPSSKKMNDLRKLMHGMFILNKYNKFNDFFEHTKFEELFIKAYGYSCAKNVVISPSYQTNSSAFPYEPSSSKSPFVEQKKTSTMVRSLM